MGEERLEGEDVLRAAIQARADQRTLQRMGALRDLSEAHKRLPHSGVLAGKGTSRRVSDLAEMVLHQTRLYVQAMLNAHKRGQDPLALALKPFDCGIFVWNGFYYVAIDPVQFAGKEGDPPTDGTYIQVHYAGTLNGENSTYVMPFTPDGKVVMNLLYRYNIDQHCIECPGTATRSGETREASIVRLLETKLGRHDVLKLAQVGAYASERGLIGDHVDYLVVIVGPRTKNPDDDIYSTLVELSADELLAVAAAHQWQHPETHVVYRATDDNLRNCLFAIMQSGLLARLSLEYPALRSWGPAILRSLQNGWAAGLGNESLD